MLPGEINFSGLLTFLPYNTFPVEVRPFLPDSGGEISDALYFFAYPEQKQKGTLIGNACLYLLIVFSLGSKC